MTAVSSRAPNCGAPALRQMLAELIATPSVSSVNPALDQSNLPLLECMAPWLENSGFRLEIIPIPGRPGKANLIATLGQGDNGLVLAGHTDTVPYDAALWHYDPFMLTEANGRLHGLGACDMKAFFALAIEAARGLSADQLTAPLVLLATADEESAMHGARALLDRGRRLGRHAVIGEPTNLKPVRAHKGVMGEAIRLHGQSGHASDPALGRSALEGMHEVMGALLHWRDELKARFRDTLFSIPYPTVNLGHIHGGDNPNRICGDCELLLDLRPLPGLDAACLRAELATLVAPIAEARGLRWEVVSLFPSIPPGATAAETEIVRVAQALTGHQAEAVNFGTELPFFNQLGMDSIVLGPGDIAQAHQPNEFLALERIEPMVSVLQSLIDHFCLSAAPPD